MIDLSLFYPYQHENHFAPGHPERPERLEAIRKALNEAGYWDKALEVKAEELTEAVLHAVHSKPYLSLLKRACRRGGYLDTDTYVTEDSWNLALQAAGGAVSIVKSVWQRESRSGFAMCRPPGHHAMRGQAMGFCLINNIALAAEYLIQETPANRLAIVDLDLHHGNGTQDIFWERGDVFFISTHQSPLYPMSGSLDEIGSGEGYKKTANFPLSPGSGDLAFSSVMEELVLPLLKRFDPEMILVSFGFDTHWSDPLGHLLLSADGYAGLIASLKNYADEFCQGRIALILEGGYDLEAAVECTLGVLSVLCDKEFEDNLGPAPYLETSGWKTMLARAKEIWDID